MKIILDSATQTARPGLKRAIRVLQKLPWEQACGHVSWPSNQQIKPDLLLLTEGHRAFFISVSDVPRETIMSALQSDLFSDAAAPDFSSQIRPLAGFCQTNDFLKIPRIWWCPLVSPALLEQYVEKNPLPDGVSALGRVDASELQNFLTEIASKPLSETKRLDLRRRFSPEIVIPGSFVPRAKHSMQETSAQFTPYLLDYDQESWVKNGLHLPEETLSEAQHCRVITGVAGSGKSLMLLYRLRLFLSQNEGRHVLLVTHNKALIAELEARFHDLQKLLPSARPNEVAFRHFYAWTGARPDSTPYNKEILKIISTIAEQIAPGHSWSEHFLQEEIHFIGDLVDDCLESYLEVKRSGRGFGLDAEARRKIHAIYLRYREKLKVDRIGDWTMPLRDAWEKMQTEQSGRAIYDLILVDEGQFFAPLWFAMLKHRLRPGGEIIIAADPTQGFLKRRQSWREIGLEVRGRVKRLERSYRCAPAILEFARKFFENRLPGKADPALDDGSALPTSAGRAAEQEEPPRLLQLSSSQDELTRLSNEVAQAIEEGLPPQSMLVICNGKLDAAETRLTDKLGPGRVKRLSEHEASRDAVALCSLNAVTGIERPVVFLIGIDHIFEEEGDPRRPDHERAELIEVNTRKLYMAMTRAGEKLVIFFKNDRTRRELEGASTENRLPTP